MTDKEIYDLWLSKFKDLRYLRPRRWKHLKDFIQKNSIKSVIEFGSGVSTLLLDSLNLDILSLETNKFYMGKVHSLCSSRVRFKLWNNMSLDIQESFDLSLVDGILPRLDQIEYAMKHSRFIVIDDYIAKSNKLLTGYKRVDLSSAPLGIFIPKDNQVMVDVGKIFSKYPNIHKLKYTNFYQRHFVNLQPKLLLEIGVLKGDSLRAWKDVFPNCKVIGIDINPLCKAENPDLNVYIGNQKDTNFLSKIINEVGLPDIVIDDGGHKRSEQVETFKFIFPKLKVDSLYIIEDLQTNYLDKWNDQKLSAIDYLKSLIDFKEHLKIPYKSITFEPNKGQSICIIKR